MNTKPMTTMNRRALGILLLGCGVSMRAFADEWLQALPVPGPVKEVDANSDKPRQDALAGRLRQVLASRQFATVDELRFFPVAADTSPDGVERNFVSAAIERGAKRVSVDGIDMHRLGLSVFAVVEQGLLFKDRYGVAMASPEPGQDTVLVAYFKLG